MQTSRLGITNVTYEQDESNNMENDALSMTGAVNDTGSPVGYDGGNETIAMTDITTQETQ